MTSFATTTTSASVAGPAYHWYVTPMLDGKWAWTATRSLATGAVDYASGTEDTQALARAAARRALDQM